MTTTRTLKDFFINPSLRLALYSSIANDGSMSVFIGELNPSNDLMIAYPVHQNPDPQLDDDYATYQLIYRRQPLIVIPTDGTWTAVERSNYAFDEFEQGVVILKK